MNTRDFIAGLERLSTLCRFQADPEYRTAMAREVAAEVAADEWGPFVAWSARRGMFQRAAPSVYELLEGLREYRVEHRRPAEARALLDDGEAGISQAEALAAMRVIAERLPGLLDGAEGGRGGGFRRAVPENCAERKPGGRIMQGRGRQR